MTELLKPAAPAHPRGLLDRLNGPHHRASLNVFLFIVIAHWAEHLTQAYQIWVLDWPVPKSKGMLGLAYPWLVTSEWMHYGYALIMLIGLFTLRRGFVGRGRAWWTAALVIQFWHHIEHLLLFAQAQSGHILFGKPVATSLLQLVVPRVELHLFYNTVVFLPMVIAMYLHLRPNATELAESSCSCHPAERQLVDA
ncbi:MULTISPECIES: hypothetical protein [unclassified Kitasatospora]|uniref:hypothetical protein n=1 Tax=unclassified Kitasatospora TaxID=2633591 RepID=UPI00070AF1FB|nr:MULTISPECIES: hypothetical protein [unclassified Kitasatospora]KQV19221.1 hypothetical protein ASC99_24000 [Kitasatospora sp. Root107]KRB77496.1 hypothetical protein ASE03_00195 [Kitasatospora sp. Root187]